MDDYDDSSAAAYQYELEQRERDEEVPVGAIAESVRWLDDHQDVDFPPALYRALSDYVDALGVRLPATPPREPRFAVVYCSCCGRSFGPNDHGYSHCAQHQGVA